MKHVLIIGAGQLGSRHLESLSLLASTDYVVSVVDPSFSALEYSKSVYSKSATNSSPNASYFSSIDNLQVKNVDLAIIATSSNVRFEVFNQLINLVEVKNIVFEKVLFQRESEYYQVEKLLAENEINGWVNCPRRSIPQFKKIKQFFGSEEIEKVVVEGNNWGLACNSIHFIDTCAFILDDSLYKINSLELGKPVPSKRSNFFEFYGSIHCQFSSGTKLELRCGDEEDISVKVSFYSKSKAAVQVDTLSFYQEQKGVKTLVYQDSFKMPFQSEMTGPLVKQLLESGDCSLTDFKEAKSLHLPFISSLLKHYNSELSLPENTILPIT